MHLCVSSNDVKYLEVIFPVQGGPGEKLCAKEPQKSSQQ